MPRLPPVGAMQAFVHVARFGTVKAAAEALSLSPPALTRRIQSLEDFVGVRLFDRQHNAMALSPEGASFLADVAPHVEALSAAVERVRGPSKGMRVRITVPSLFASQRLIPMLPSLRERHPNIQVAVDTAANRLGRLGDDVDAAIVVASSVEEKYYSRFLEQGRIAAIASPELAEGKGAIRKLTDLKRATVLLHRDMPGNFDAWRKSAGFPGLNPREISYFDSGQLVLEAAAQGLGVAFMLESHLRCSTDGRLVQLFEHTTRSPYSYWFACEEGALSRRPIRLFHDWLFENFAAV